MTTQTITSVALHVVDQYHQANKHLVQAYRASARRAIGSVGETAARIDAFFGERKLPMMNEELKAGIANAHNTVTGFLVSRLDSDTERLIGMMDSVAQRTAGGIQSASEVAARAETAFNVKASEPLRALNMPVAQIASQIADKVAESAKAIEVRAAGAVDAETAVSTVVAKPARRAARA